MKTQDLSHFQGSMEAEVVGEGTGRAVATKGLHKAGGKQGGCWPSGMATHTSTEQRGGAQGKCAENNS